MKIAALILMVLVDVFMFKTIKPDDLINLAFVVTLNIIVLSFFLFDTSKKEIVEENK